MNPNLYVLLFFSPFLIMFFSFMFWIFREEKRREEQRKEWNEEWKEELRKFKGETQMSEVNFLLQKLHDVRVLRSSCSDSHEGKFRVHLPEEEWDEIQKLAKELREKNK